DPFLPHPQHASPCAANHCRGCYSRQRMRTTMRGFRSLIVWVSVLLPAVAQKQLAAPQAPPVVWRAPANANPDLYAGLELCSACHAAEAQQFAKTVHAKA